VATTYGRHCDDGAASPLASKILTVSLPFRYDVSTFFFEGCPVTLEGETLELLPVADGGNLAEPWEDEELDTFDEDVVGGCEEGAAAGSFLGLMPCLLSGGWLSLNSGGGGC
jgi:hypothetical protein